MSNVFYYECAFRVVPPRLVPPEDADMIVVDKSGRIFTAKKGLLLDVVFPDHREITKMS